MAPFLLTVLYRTGTGTCAVEEGGGFVGLAGFDVRDERNLVAAGLARETIKHALVWGDDECAVAADLAGRTGAAQLVAGRFELSPSSWMACSMLTRDLSSWKSM